MKSLFKRAFAAVTGSALAFSQIAATAVNINAAGDPLNVNKAWVLNVALDRDSQKEALKAYLDPMVVNEAITEATFAEGAELKNTVSSTWKEELEAWMDTRLGGKESITQETNATQLKQEIKTYLISNIERIRNILKARLPENIMGQDVDSHIDQIRLIDDATAKKIEDKIHDKGEMTISIDGTATETVVIDDLGEIMGNAVVNYIKKVTGNALTDADGNPIEFNWKDYHIGGTVAVTVDFRKETEGKKELAYSVSFTTVENQKIANFTDMSNYFLKKAYNQDYSKTGKEPGAIDIVFSAVQGAKDDAQKKVDDAKAQYTQKKAELDDAHKQYDEKYAEFQEKSKDLDAKEADLKNAQEKLDKAKADLADAKSKGADTTKEEKDVEDRQAEWNDANQKLADAKVKRADAEKQFADAKTKLDDADKQAADAEAKLKDADAQLAAAQGKIDTWMGKVNKGYANKELINDVIGVFSSIKVEDDDPNDAYGQYIKLAEAGLQALDIPQNYIDKILNNVNKRLPNNLYNAAEKAETNPKTSKMINLGVSFLNKAAGEKAKVSLTTEDITGIMKEGYNWSTKINGFTTENVFDYKMGDEEIASLLDAVKAVKDADYKEKYNKEIVGVEAHKKITLNSTNDYNVFKGNAQFDVELIVTKLLLKDIEKTDTTSSETTGSETTGTTGSTESTGSETGSTESTGSETGSTDSTGSETGSTESTGSETGSTESTGSTTDSTASTDSTDSTGSTTETTVSTDSTASTGSTEESTVSTDSTASTESGTSTDDTSSGTGSTGSTDSSETGTTTAASSIAFIAEGMPEELIYWSEEDTDFTFTNLKITMNIYTVNAEKTGYDLAKAVDVTKAFTPNAKAPKDFEFKGFSKYEIQYQISDAASIQKEINAAGFNAEALMKQDNIQNGTNAQNYTAVYLVLRGDYDLDGKVDSRDAKKVLDYAVATQNTKYDTKTAAEKGLIDIYGNEYNNLKYQHYAADTYDGIGTITSIDAKAILDYYVAVKMTHLKGAEDWTYAQYVMNGKKIVPLDKLHSDPFAYDTYAKYGDNDSAHPLG